MKVPESVSRSVAKVVPEEVYTNERLQVLLGLVCMILVTYFWLVLHDYRLFQEDEGEKLVARYEQLHSVAGQQGWRDYSETIGLLQGQAAERLWNVSSEGVAKATIQSVVEQMLSANQIEAKHIKAEAAYDNIGDQRLVKIILTVIGDYNSYGFMGFIRDLEAADKLLVVDYLDISGHQRTRTFNMTISGWGVVAEVVE